MRVENNICDNNINTRPRVFLSYSSKDKEKAEEIQGKLDLFGIDVFVSYDDIGAGEEWYKVIVKNIRERECFVPLISENYHGANYTEQEFGMAMAMNKKIIPITYDRTDPVGFGAVYQCRQLEPETSIRELIESITNTQQGREYMDIIISKISYSHSYDETNSYAAELLKWLKEGYVPTSQQYDSIQQAFGNNRQVTESFVMHDVIEYLDK